jgi:phosphoribosylanthranilate isomerase
MILWPGSKRSVKESSLAAEIAAAAREGGAEPVGVFVDESPEQARARAGPPAGGRASVRRSAADVCTTGRPSRAPSVEEQAARAEPQGRGAAAGAQRTPPLRSAAPPALHIPTRPRTSRAHRDRLMACAAHAAVRAPSPQIIAACDAAGITTAQLHGDAARLSLAGLPARLRAIYVMTASADGALTTPLPGALIEPKKDLMAGAQGWRKAVDWVSFGRRTCDWLLVDGTTPGSGEAYDWRGVRVPRGASRRGWLLAGGLTPENVGDALRAARPDGVDVASGVAAACGVRKDPQRVEAFVAAVRAAAAQQAAA